MPKPDRTSWKNVTKITPQVLKWSRWWRETETKEHCGHTTSYKDVSKCQMRNTLAKLLVSDISESAEPIFTGGAFLRGTSIWSLFLTNSLSMSPLSLAYPDELSRCRSTSVGGTPDPEAGAARGGGGAVSAEMLLSTSRLTAPAAAEPVTDTTTGAPECDDSMSEPDCFNSMFSNSSPLTITGEPTTAETGHFLQSFLPTTLTRHRNQGSHSPLCQHKPLLTS